MRIVKQKVVIQSSDSVKFALLFEDAIVKGLRIDRDSPQRITAFPHKISMYAQGDSKDHSWHVQSDANTVAYPLAAEDKIYTKEALGKLEWEEFKEVVGVYGVKGRDRGVMTNKYLEETSDK